MADRRRRGRWSARRAAAVGFPARDGRAGMPRRPAGSRRDRGERPSCRRERPRPQPAHRVVPRRGAPRRGAIRRRARARPGTARRRAPTGTARRSMEVLAAVDDHRLARDEVCGRRAEEHHRTDDVLGHLVALDRPRGDGDVAQLLDDLGVRLHALGHREAGRDAVDVDRVLPELFRERPREARRSRPSRAT